MKKTLLSLIFFLQFLILSAQTAIDVEHEYGSYPGFADGNVYSAAIQPDGKILVGGAFSSYKGDNTSRILIRLNPDGTKDTSFNIGTGFSNSMYSNYISSIILQDDGKMIVGGIFTKFQGFPQNYIIRLNSDGSKDASFNSGTGFMDNPNGDSTVLTMVKQIDGKILIGGGFLGYQGISNKYLIRLNADGTKDTSFDIGTSFNSTVTSIALQNDGKIVVGGKFNQFQGVSQNRLIRLNTDGSKDTSFDISSGFDDTVNNVLIQSDGKIVAGGYFSRYSSISQNGLIRINPNGTKDSTFDIFTGFSFPSVTALSLQSDGKLIVGGMFLYYRGISQNHLVRLNSDGTKDNSFNVGTGYGGGQTDRINFIVAQQNGKILTGGNFTDYQGIIVNNFLSINNDGSKDNTMETGKGFNSPVYAIVQQTDGKTIVGGKFINYQQTLQKGLIRFNADNSVDKSFNIDTGFANSNGSTAIIESLALQTDGKLFVGGQFNTYQGNQQNCLIRLNTNGSKDSSFDIGTGFNLDVRTIIPLSSGKVLVSGNFTTYKGKSQNYLARLNADGTNDTSFNIGNGFNSTITSMAVQTDGKIVVGGSFTTFQGITQKYLMRLNTDGTKDNTFNIGSGFNFPVQTIAIQNNDKILVGGQFTTFQGNQQNYIIRLNPDGTKDTSFDIGSGFNNYVFTLAIQADDKIIVGGQFGTYQNVSQLRLACLNPDGSRDKNFNVGQGFFRGYILNDSFINYVKIQNDGKIIVAGDYVTYKENANSAFLIRLKGTEVVLSNDEFTQKKNLFSLSPNPTKNILNINSLNENNYSVKIYDLLGKLIYSKENVNSPIDVSSFISGLYLIKIKAESGETSQKFIKI